MPETLAELVQILEASTLKLKQSYGLGDMDTSRECARIILSAGSKAHARLSIFVDMRRNGEWTAEVDRALKRTQQPRRAEIPGQTSITDHLKSAERKGSRSKPRSSS